MRRREKEKDRERGGEREGEREKGRKKERKEKKIKRARERRQTASEWERVLVRTVLSTHAFFHYYITLDFNARTLYKPKKPNSRVIWKALFGRYPGFKRSVSPVRERE